MQWGTYFGVSGDWVYLQVAVLIGNLRVQHALNLINLRFWGAPVETCQEKSPEKKDDAIVPWGDWCGDEVLGNSLVNVVIQCDLTDRDWDLNPYCRWVWNQPQWGHILGFTGTNNQTFMGLELCCLLWNLIVDDPAENCLPVLSDVTLFVSTFWLKSEPQEFYTLYIIFLYYILLYSIIYYIIL